MSAAGILSAIFGGDMVKMLSGEGALDALSPAMWSTMRVTLLVCLIFGLVLLFTKTINGMLRAEPEIVLSKLLTSSRGLRFFWDHLKYQMYGTQPPTRKYNGEPIGNPVASSVGSVFAMFRGGLEWMLTWLPSGEVGGHFDKLPDMIQDKRASSSASSASSTASSRKGKKQAAPIKTQPSVSVPATGGKMKKRHSMPSLPTAPIVKPVALPVVQEDQEDEGFVPVKRDRSITVREEEPEPVNPPHLMDAVPLKARRSHSRDETKLEQRSETALPAAISSAALSMLDVNDSLGEVESKFAKYFHSTAATASASRTTSISSCSGDSVTSTSATSTGPRDNVYRPPALAISAKSRPSLDSTEKRLVDGELTPPPGFGRRTKSVVPKSTTPVNPATVNPNTTSSTAYRRPTGTFASKGYALTSESVFAARASPINPTAPPLETRTQSFFQQRLSVSRGSSPAPVAPQKSATPEPQTRAPLRRASAAVEEKTIFEPIGQRKSLFPRTWSPWAEEDSMVPPGAHLKPAGIIGSRPSSSNPSSEEDTRTPEPLAEPFSLFNMDLFTRTPSQ